MAVVTIIAGIAFLGFLAVVIVRAIQDAEETRANAWARAGQRFGLGVPPRGFWRTTSQELEGAVDGMHVSVKGQGGKGARTVYEMQVPNTSLQLTAEGVSSAIGRWFSGQDVQIGDAAFDSKAVIRGDEAEHRALFDAQTRRAALHVLRLGGWVSDGKIRIESRGLEDKTAAIEETLEAMVTLARRLAWAHQVAPSERLAAVASDDPLPEVRRNALSSLLVRAMRDKLPHALVERAVATALDDVDAGNRLFAATCGRVPLARSREVLVALVRESRTPDAVRAKAIAALGRFEGIEDADGVLDAVLERGVNEARIAAIRAVVLRQGNASRILPYAGLPHAPTREAVAKALGSIGTSAAQSVLVDMLDDEAEPVRLAAAGALGAIGDIRAVAALRGLTAKGLFGGEIARAAETAISSIQSRAAGAGAGQLSVSEAPDAAGSLSNAVEDGSLSEPDPPPNARPRKTPA